HPAEWETGFDTNFLDGSVLAYLVPASSGEKIPFIHLSPLEELTTHETDKFNHYCPLKMCFSFFFANYW
ncbi:MAG: calponin homology domain-containing protein, partial [Flavobacteriaceae bacterium]|nr:calponin homology domain-containing protein [Flavobacteriaceae bacterium]